MDLPLAQHAFTPVLRLPAKGARQRSAGDLHPDTGLQKSIEHRILALNPSQTLWMRQNWDVAGHHNVEEEFFQSCRGYVMWRLDQYIARIGQAEQSSAGQTGDEISDDVIVGTSHQPQRYAGTIERGLKVGHGFADLRAGVVIEPR